MLKLDIAKAFDSVAWPFLLEVLRQRGFGPRWLARLTTMLSTASTKVLVNGLAGVQFWHARGLRQGDPGSPMFFLLVIDVLNAIFRLAEELGIFESLADCGVRHRLSLFADDVVLFIKPSVHEASAAIQLLNLFGGASGLRCNLNKSSASPIRCDCIDLQPVLAVLGCPVQNFPIQYLGLPLTIGKLTKTDLQPLVDKVAGHVPTWKAGLLQRSGRLILLDSTLTATPVYHMLSLDLPAWFFTCIDKLLRGFFWSAATEARRGQCVVAWKTVCLPKQLGGLGVKNLRLMNHALRARWRWLQLTQADKPWQGLEFKLAPEAEDLCLACTRCVLGDGRKLLFWNSNWLDGVSIKQLAPNLMDFVRPQALKDTVAEALLNRKWVSDIRGSPSIPAIVEFLQVWDRVRNQALADEEDEADSEAGSFQLAGALDSSAARRQRLQPA